MNRHSLQLSWRTSVVSIEYWNFIIISDERPEFLKQLIIDAQKEFNFESPVDLMDYVCDTYDMRWEDHSFDIEIDTNEIGM